LYSKCEVADGTRTGASAKRRRLAVEKLGFFGTKVLTGVSEFIKHARRLGLTVGYPVTPPELSEYDLSLITSSSRLSESGASPASHRSRRRVSRVNSTKGYKSFNAVRQWRTEHFHKFTAAKRAIELLQTE
jgi:hypothetical protein